MNDMALDSVFSSGKLGVRIFGTKSNRQSSAFYGYSLVAIATGVGWLLRNRSLVNPEEGLGYWLGIVGGSMMLLLLLYPLRKRLATLSFLGSTKSWFRAHMILGLLGPLLVLYHSNFHIGSFNSQVALYCMLLVAGSGVVGRHIYAHVHRGLYGHKTSLDELRSDLKNSLEASSGLATLLPGLAARMDAESVEVQGDQLTQSLDASASLKWKIRRYTLWFSLWRTANQELKIRAAESPTIKKDLPRLKKSTSIYIRKFVRMMSNVAQFTLYEKLLSVWHVLHMPFFFMMIISALLHVLAVHMY